MTTQTVIVDDDGFVQSLAARALADYDGCVARDGAEALALERRLGRCDLLHHWCRPCAETNSSVGCANTTPR